MDVVIELTQNKHAYARQKDGHIILRIPSHLSANEKKKVVQLLLDKVATRKQRPDHVSLFSTLYGESTVVLWNKKEYTFWIEKKRVHYVLVQQPTSCSVEHALAEQRCSKKEIKTMLLQFLRKEALEDVRTVIMEYAQMIGASDRLTNVCITDAKTKWGSAHTGGTIRISLKTLLLPEHLFRYVCAHEASHLIHMHHGKDFWKTLERMCPNTSNLRKELHHYGY